VTSNIPTYGQMIMGFILPFTLTFVAIPFESFVASSRTVLGLVVAFALRALAFVLRLLGNLGFYLSRLVINAYDLAIVPALWLEGVIVEKRAQSKATGENKAQTDAATRERRRRSESSAQQKEAIE